MRILFISNYNAWERIRDGVMPSHHLFGVNEMIDHFETPDSAILKSQFGGGKIDFVKVANPSKIELLKLYAKCLSYDVVYDVLTAVSKQFGVLNKFHLFRPRLVTVFHHPPFDKMMKYAKSDCSVFFTEELMNEARNCIKDNRQVVCNKWYPEKAWYDKNKQALDSKKVYDFLDNGKTARDHNLFIRCMRLMPNKRAVIVTDKMHIPTEYKEGENVDLFFQDKPNDLTMLQLCLKTKVMVIPLEENKKMLGPIGATSYMDAIALGMPVVTNEKAAFAKEIVDNGIGCLFKLNEESLAKALEQSLEKYDKLHNAMASFSEHHSIGKYTEILSKYLFN